jgi:ribosome assembly protein 4
MPGDTKFYQPYQNPSKRLVKKEETAPQAPTGTTVVAQFKSPEGNISGPSVNLPADVTPEQLQLLLNNLLNNVWLL